MKIRTKMNSVIRVHACRNGRRLFAAASRREYVASRHSRSHYRLAPVVSSVHPTLRGFSSSSAPSPNNDDEPPKPDQPDDKEENHNVDAGDVPPADSMNPCAHLPFPWYHVPHGRLSRLDENNDLSGLPRTTRARFVRKTLAARELGVPWYQIFLTGSWERDLAQNFTWAFRRATAALLSKTFRVPIDIIDIDDDESGDGFGSVSIDTTKVSNDGNGEDVMSEDDMEETNALVEAMLEEDLLAVYQNLDPTKIQIKFKMQPISCQFESALVVPMFTRQHVKQNPSLKGAYQKIEAEFVDSGSVQKVREMAEKLHKQAGSTGERALIAEVSIDCMESLEVYDAESGALIQEGSFPVTDSDSSSVGDDGEKKGDGDEQQMQSVQHLVRMEMVTSRAAEPGTRCMGSWKITDWDDFLEGNVWH